LFYIALVRGDDEFPGVGILFGRLTIDVAIPTDVGVIGFKDEVTIPVEDKELEVFDASCDRNKDVV